MPDPNRIIAERRRRLPELAAEEPTALAELSTALTLSRPIAPQDPADAVPEIEARLPELLARPLDEDGRIWLITRLMHFAAAVVRQRWGGSWRVESNPAGRFFQRYVIGGFTNLDDGIVIDPAAIAAAAVGGERLGQLLEEAASVLAEAAQAAGRARSQ